MAIDFGDIASRYATARLDQAMQPFTDPEAYANNRLQQQFGVDLGGNVKPKSTTITNNDDGTQTVTEKHEVTPTPQAAPTYGGPGIGEGAYQMPVAQVAPQAMPQATTAVAPTPQAAPVVTPDTAAIDEQRRRQLEQLQLQQAQAAQQSQQMAPAPSGPAVPTVEREVPQAAPMPVSPEQAAVNQVNATQLPQPSPVGVQVAGGPPGTGVAQAAQLATAATVPNPDEQHQQAIVDAHNEKDPVARRQKFARLAATEGVSEGNRQLAHQYMAEEYLNDKQVKKAEQKLATATPLDIQRYMKDKSPEGSYVKAILFARLGLNDLARQEQEKISPSVAMGSEIGADGQRYSVVRNKEGFITKAFDTTGAEATPEKVAELSATALGTKGVTSHTGKMQDRTTGKVYYEQTSPQGVRLVEPGTGNVYSGDSKNLRPYGIGSDIDTQRAKAIALAQVSIEKEKGSGRIRALEDVNKKRIAEGLDPLSAAEVGMNDKGESIVPTTVGTGGGQQLNAVQLATRLGLPIVSGVRDQAKQQAMWDDSVRAGRTGFMANGNPIAKPGTSKHENGMAVDGTGWTPEQKQIARANGLVNNIPGDPDHWELRQPAGTTTATSVAELTRQREEAVKVGGKRSESFNKHVDEKLVPAAENGLVGSDTVKKQMKLLNDPNNSVLFGLYDASQTNSAGDKRWAIIRDVFSGAVSKDAKEVSEAVAQLGLNSDQRSALDTYAALNVPLVAATVHQIGGAQISDRDRAAAEKAQVDIGRTPALGAFNIKSGQQFGFDMARYKADWATTQKVDNIADLNKLWNKEQSRLVEQNGVIADQRMSYLKSIAGDKPANTAQVRAAFQKYPVPEYDPNLNGGVGGWKKLRQQDLKTILGVQ